MTPLIETRHNGTRSWLERGDAVSLEYPDGKGVSGRLAGVDIAAGGAAFALIVTHDGTMPDTTPIREMIMTVQASGYVVQETEDYQAGLRIEYEWGIADGRSMHETPETSAEAVNGQAQGDDPADRIDLTRERLRASEAENVRLRMELELSRERTVDLAQQHRRVARSRDGLLNALSEARQEATRLAEELSTERSLRASASPITLTVNDLGGMRLR